MKKANICLQCVFPEGVELNIDTEDMQLDIEIFGNLFVSELCPEQLKGINASIKLPVTQLQISRILYWARHGVILERPYISIA